MLASRAVVQTTDERRQNCTEEEERLGLDLGWEEALSGS